MGRVRLRFFAIVGVLLTAALGGESVRAGDDIVTFGIVPQQSAAKLARVWTPVLKQISKEAGVELRFKTATDIPTFEKRLAAGEYDISYMNPYHYTVFNRSPGYVAFAREKDKRIKGILVTRKDSPYEVPEDLTGLTLAFPSPAAFAASVLPRAHFKTKGIVIAPKYVSSHDSVYRSVAKGLYPAGGGVVRTFKAMTPAVSDQLRILWTTKTYTPHAIAAHPRLPAATVKRIASAMVALSETEQGKHLLAPLKFTGIEAAKDGDWDDVRGLGLQLLDSLIRE